MKGYNIQYCFLNLANFLYLLCGIGLVTGSIFVLSDTDRVLISRLIPVNSHQPILYYVCLVVLALGLTVSILSTLGCWAIYAESNCLLVLYIFGVVVLVLAEGIVGVITVICPQYLGMALSREVSVQQWQNNYGVPGREQYTVAIDLFQIRSECCGIISGNDYSTSWWYVKNIAAPNLTVPISCCTLDRNATKSYLDPVPIELHMCQEPLVEIYHDYRNNEGCFMHLEHWLREQKITILFAVLINIAMQLLLLFALISSCVSLKEAAYEASVNNPQNFVYPTLRTAY